MCIPTIVFMKPADGFRSFLDIFLLIQRSNCMQGPVLLQASFLAFFQVLPGTQKYLLVSACTPSVFQHSFSCNQMMDFVNFCIYSFLHVLLPVPKGQLRYKQYFLYFPCLYTTTCALIKPVDELSSFSGKFLFIHHTSFNKHLQVLRLRGGTSQLRPSLLGVALVLTTSYRKQELFITNVQRKKSNSGQKMS